MLDVHKLSAQLAEVSLELAEEATQTEHRRIRAQQVYDDAVRQETRLRGRLTPEWLAEAPWPVAHPVEPLGQITAAPPRPPCYSLVATDGSQIIPNHHEITSCFLINVGRILYTYGTGERPIQDSQPFLHREAELYKGSTRPGTGAEELIGIERFLAEMSEMSKLADQARERGHPCVALVDGTLIQWPLEKQPEAFQQYVLGEFLRHMENLQRWGIPVAGYLSNSRAAEVSNMLRVHLCPNFEAACATTRTCQGEPPDCAELMPLWDRQLWGSRLQEGERSPLFECSARILQRYPWPVDAFYLNVGDREIARIEVPAWVANDPDKLRLVHAVALDQARKGYGYPIALAEAHNQAVIRREDRAQFFALITRRLLHRRMRVAVSNKELRKRRGMV